MIGFTALVSFIILDNQLIDITEISQLQKHDTTITSYVPKLLAGREKFVGRSKELQQIDLIFKQGQVIVLNGRSGVGKTIVSTVYACTGTVAEYIRFFHSGSADKLSQQFHDLAYELNIDIERQNDTAVTNLVYNKLSKIPGKILFIFDDVNRYDDIKNYLINLPQNIKLIISTQQTKLARDIPHIKISNFNIEEATDYITRVLNNEQYDRNTIIQLINKIGTLPYNLKCAVAYLLENPFIEPKTILNIDVTQISNKLFEQIILRQHHDIESKLTWEILQYLGHLDRDFIDINIINKLFPDHNDIISKVIKKLENLSIISVIVNSKQKAGIQIHQHIQEEIKELSSQYSNNAINKDTLQYNLLSVLNSMLPNVNHTHNKDWTIYSDLLPHVLKNLELKTSIVTTEMELLHAHVFYKLGKYYFSAAKVDFKKALLFSDKALKTYSKIYNNEKTKEIANALENIGLIYVYGFYSKFDEGLSLLKQSLKIKKNLYDSTNPEISQLLREIGIVYLIDGNIDESLKYAIKVLETRRAYYNNTNNIYVAEALNDIARCYYELGKYDKAKTYIIQSIKIYKDLKPENSSDTLYALHTLGSVLVKLNQIQEGIRVLLVCEKIIKKYSMQQHYSASCIYYELAQAYLVTGNLQKAKMYVLMSLNTRQFLHKINGHANSLFETLNLLGDVHLKLGNKTQAEEAYINAKQILSNWECC